MAPCFPNSHSSIRSVMFMPIGFLNSIAFDDKYVFEFIE